MTVAYNLDVANVSCFSWIKLFFRWRGSIWKSVLNELIVWLILYYIVMFIYRSDLILDTKQQENFERVAAHVNVRVVRIPLTFLLGFFVTQVVDRWRQILLNMGWIENVALTTAALIQGSSDRIRLIRRSIVRYMVLSQVLVFRDIAISVRRRFPTMGSLVQTSLYFLGFLQEHELKMLEDVDIDEKYNKYWVPINWACSLCFKLQDGAKPNANPVTEAVVHSGQVNYLLNEFKFFRNNLQTLCNFDWVPIPLAYPQVIFLAVRVYFGICVVGRQFIIGNDEKTRTGVDMYFPMMTVFEFIFLVGWMKVAEALLNPFGEDDDDFECNYLIDKNIATGLSIVDDEAHKHPELFMDKFKTNQTPVYSEDSKKYGNNNILMGSVANLLFTEPDKEVKMVELPPMSAAPSMESLAGNKTIFANSLGNMRLRRKLRDSLLRITPRSRSQSTCLAPSSVVASVATSPILSPTGVGGLGSISRLPSLNVSRAPSTEERPFELSFNSFPLPPAGYKHKTSLNEGDLPSNLFRNPTFLKNDIVHEEVHEDMDDDDEHQSTFTRNQRPPRLQHTTSRISEVSEEDRSPTEKEKPETQLEEIPENGPSREMTSRRAT